ncbi:MAG: electron transfer flavoprotein subunit alpha [Kiritimatiellae bacterium]|nr:electron transfer flavoprotein subunit alpha [Kiritimatiellia bacterium]
MKILALFHTQDDGSLPKAALEVLTTAMAIKEQTGGTLAVGILGQGAANAAETVAGCGAESFLTVGSEAVAQARYATDTAAATALIRDSGAELVLAPGTARFARCLPGAAHRTGAQIDTHIVSVKAEGGQVQAQRWFYRQRILGTFSRAARPWIMLADAGVNMPWHGASGAASPKEVAVGFSDADLRTSVTGVRSPAADAQTIKPDAALLFVAGAGWTKKQKDGQFHIAEAGVLIQDFLIKAKSSLGSSKSLVDLQSEGQETLNFMTHMNQVGQTGSTPRHAKGLSACCHGEEPHAVGWRFINERRAINLDPNCGWAQGKADVVYVGDAFEIMAKVNALLS